MTQQVASDTLVRIAPGHRLQWEEAQQAYVLLYPEGMVTLNTSASEILKRCEGGRTIAEIVTDLRQHFPGADVEPDVLKFLEVAKDNGWVLIKERE